MKKTKLEGDLSDLINCECRENDSNTPDFLLAEFMVKCLDAFELAINKREVWLGVELDILDNWKELIMAAIGEVSMCWSEIDKAGIFDSEKARKIGERLLKDIKRKDQYDYE